MTPTARTLDLLRRSGFLAEVVEKWIPRVNKRRDLFGIGDVLGVHPIRREFLLVQSTSASNVSARLEKARHAPGLAAWLRAGGRFEVHGWQLVEGRWTVRQVELRAEDLATIPVSRPRRRGGRRPVQRDLFGTVEK
jgi:hypothetical protein